jgi:hypothetical protein
MSSHGCAAMAPMIFGARWVVTDSSPKTKQKAELQLRLFEVHYDQVHYDQVHYDQVHYDQVHHDQVHHY